MDPVTHLATGVAISQLVPAPSRPWAAVAGVLFAVLPDLDYVLALNDRLAYLRHHRGFTHSLVAIPLFALLVALLGRWVGGPKWFRPLLLLGVLVLASHLFLDLATSYGTQILNPFTREKYTLDWLFIIDPHLTVLLLAAALALCWPGWGRVLGLVCLTLAGAYILLCGFYHQRALSLAQQVFGERFPGASVAALPQPFSFRRWQLVATAPGEIGQAFVELPAWPWGNINPKVREIPVKLDPQGEIQVPPSPYHSPEALEIYRWRAASPAPENLSPEARRLLDTYLEFTRFPLLAIRHNQDSSLVLTWLDLRFSVPGRRLPFMLSMRLNPAGGLISWNLGSGRPPPDPESRPGRSPG